MSSVTNHATFWQKIMEVFVSVVLFGTVDKALWLKIVVDIREELTLTMKREREREREKGGMEV